MSTNTANRLPVTAAEYLEGERKSEIRHEFVDGRIDLTLPVSAFCRAAPFPDDVARPWYLRYREDG